MKNVCRERGEGRKLTSPELVGSGCWSDGASASGVRVLAVVLSCLHLEYVGNDAVDGDVTDQTCEEELFRDAGVHEAEGRETGQDTGQPAETNPRLLQF